MPNILIIKLGAMGDVLRTTSLLRALDGEVYWVTNKNCISLLLESGKFLKQAIDIDYAQDLLSDINFDLVLSLDDEFQAAALAADINKTVLVGSYLDSGNKISYTESSKAWFDMGLISKFSKDKANKLKKCNAKTYQDIIFKMAEKEFKGEEYILNLERTSDTTRESKRRLLIGIESRADLRWPSKKWDKYVQLGALLSREEFRVKFLQQRDTLRQYIDDISRCDLIITGDTLAMHIALALRIKVVGIFTCTSPQEIYGYGRMTKIISPLLSKAFYSQEYVEEAVRAISLDSVYKAVMGVKEEGVTREYARY